MSSQLLASPKPRFDLLHDALAEVEAHGLSSIAPIEGMYLDLLYQALDRRGAGEIILRGIRAGIGGGRVCPEEILQSTWVKLLTRVLVGQNAHDLRERFPDPGQFAGTLWLAGRNKARDAMTALGAARRREISIDACSDDNEPKIPEAQLVARSSSDLAVEDELEVHIDGNRLRDLLKDYLARNCSAQGKQSLPRLLALVDLDFNRVMEDGRLPETRLVRRILGFPSAATVSQARLRYRDVARQIFPNYGAR